MKINLLKSKHPILADPDLAKRIGLNEAIILQKFNYLINYNIDNHNPRSYHNGKYWTFNTYKTWHEKYFNWWGLNTVKRTIKSLKDKKLIETNNFNQKGFDNTKWYTINYDNPILVSYMNDDMMTHNGIMDNPKSNSGQYKNGSHNTTYYPQNNRETKSRNLSKLKNKIHDTFSTVTPYTLNIFKEWLNDLSLELMLHGLDEAKRYNAQNIKYVYSIYDKWKTQNIHSLNDLKASKTKSSNHPKYKSNQYETQEKLKQDDNKHHAEFNRKMKRMNNYSKYKTSAEIEKERAEDTKRIEDRIEAKTNSGKSIKQAFEEIDHEDDEELARKAMNAINKANNKK